MSLPFYLIGIPNRFFQNIPPFVHQYFNHPERGILMEQNLEGKMG
jgi:hypothetical protein